MTIIIIIGIWLILFIIISNIRKSKMYKYQLKYFNNSTVIKEKYGELKRIKIHGLFNYVKPYDDNYYLVYYTIIDKNNNKYKIGVIFPYNSHIFKAYAYLIDDEIILENS